MVATSDSFKRIYIRVKFRGGWVGATFESCKKIYIRLNFRGGLVDVSSESLKNSYKGKIQRWMGGCHFWVLKKVYIRARESEWVLLLNSLKYFT